MSTSSASFAGLCAVCDKPGSLRCGACKALKFCSPECQSLLWPTHKVLCGRDLDTFFMPPMSPKEITQLERVKDEPVCPDGSNFLTQMDISWPAFADRLRSDAHAEPLGEFLRLDALLTAHRRLGKADKVDPPRVAVSPSPWRIFADKADAWTVRSSSLAHGSNDVEQTATHVVDAIYAGRSPFTVLNAVLRQHLVAATIMYQVVSPTPKLQPAEALALVRLSDKRLVEALRRSDMSDEQRLRLDPALERKSPGDVD
ncbi:uncharacterized protein RHOBADRAFT_41318 [Rhodotorula graminis WP1]|uniref:MYND-type domain-containing protein n=1 Tax=Rhodotorula graminis (strain WP1) TaxID=578459 RepID=A0A194S9Q9_RHOGW|nr:uncharacterized protein RHOBADRAFT_41318 [Rhodotorula graminis WP1]KPV77324.1 hypothetical protein RHOBADRAFT_41318 [Rhodotorula graminis WP1]